MKWQFDRDSILPPAMNIVVDGRYQIIKRLGKGGFAHTYLAKNLAAPGEPTCVVKQLRPKIENACSLQLFKLESEILARLQHRQIPQRIEYFEHQGDCFLVQDFIAGDDLSKEFTIGHQWSEVKVAKFLREMLGVLNYLHHKQVIHRDIKPANIIRRWDNGQLCPIDFGAVRDVSGTLDAPTTVVGTPGYYAPEQLGGEATFSSDIYALGMSAIQFLTGQYPQHLPVNDDREVVWRDLTTIGDELAEILIKMTRAEPKDRYQSAVAVLTDLDKLNLPHEDHRATANPASWKKMAAGIFIGLACIGGGILHSYTQPAPVNVETEAMLDRTLQTDR